MKEEQLVDRQVMQPVNIGYLIGALDVGAESVDKATDWRGVEKAHWRSHDLVEKLRMYRVQSLHDAHHDQNVR